MHEVDMGLRTRLLLLVSLAAIPALLLALYTNLEQRRVGASKVQKDAVRLVQLAAAKEIGFVDSTRETLAGLARMREALGTNVPVFDAFFNNLAKFYPNYVDFGLIETNGSLVASAFGRSGVTNLADRAHLQRVMATRHFAIGGYEPEHSLTKPSLLFGQPVFNTNGALARVIYAALDLHSLNTVVTNTRLPEGSVVTVLDAAGKILACRPEREKWVGRSAADWSLWRVVGSRKEGTAEGEGLDGVDRLYAFTSVQDEGGPRLFVTVGIPTALAYAETQHILVLNLTILGVVSICIWLVAWVYANRYILKPVEALRGMTRKVAAGDLSARTEISESADELNQLGKAFNALAENLQMERTETERSQQALRLSERRVRELNAELEDRVRKRTAQLEQAYQELEAFSYSVSHDLRAPLRPIHGYVELLQQELGPGLSEEPRRQLKAVSSAAKRMGTLIDNLLAFSRMGRSELRHQLVNMGEILQEVVRELRAETEGRIIHWQINPLPEVQGDRPMLKQVWANLLSNAIKYTRLREAAEVRISSQSNDTEFEFCIRDNGAGFDMKYAHKLFSVFQRLHQVDEFEGTGIGLANVRRIISRHGGRVWAQGELQIGAAFFFTLPRDPVQTEAAPRFATD